LGEEPDDHFGADTRALEIGGQHGGPPIELVISQSLVFKCQCRQVGRSPCLVFEKVMEAEVVVRSLVLIPHMASVTRRPQPIYPAKARGRKSGKPESKGS